MPRNNVITVRVSTETTDADDAVRGTASRSAWVEGLIAAELGRAREPKAGTASTDPAAPGRCPHPRGRVIKGFCYRCGSMVLPG